MKLQSLIGLREDMSCLWAGLQIFSESVDTRMIQASRRVLTYKNASYHTDE